jgi:hypothetical protein
MDEGVQSVKIHYFPVVGFFQAFNQRKRRHNMGAFFASILGGFKSVLRGLKGKKGVQQV